METNILRSLSIRFAPILLLASTAGCSMLATGAWVINPKDVDAEYDGLEGKRVAVGPPGGNNFVMTWTILKAYGFTEKDIKPVYQTYVESVGAMKDGAIDAVFVLAGYPTSAILDLSTTRDIRMIPMESNMIKKVTDEFKFYSDGAVPPGVYRGVTQTIPGLAVQNVWIAYKDLPETLVYKIVKAIFDQKDYLVTVHKKAAEMNLQDAVKVPCPMHPGAIKYFKEKGALK